MCHTFSIHPPCCMACRPRSPSGKPSKPQENWRSFPPGSERVGRRVDRSRPSGSLRTARSQNHSRVRRRSPNPSCRGPPLVPAAGTCRIAPQSKQAEKRIRPSTDTRPPRLPGRCRFPSRHRRAPTCTRTSPKHSGHRRRRRRAPRKSDSATRNRTPTQPRRIPSRTDRKADRSRWARRTCHSSPSRRRHRRTLQGRCRSCSDTANRCRTTRRAGTCRALCTRAGRGSCCDRPSHSSPAR
jgi:hypothetical protein